MNFKTTYILFGVLLGVLLIFGLTQFLGLKKPGELEAWVLPSLHENKKKPPRPDAFDTLEIERSKPAAEKLVFVRRDNKWTMVEPYPLRTESAVVEEMIAQIVNARKDKSDVTTDLAYYELDAPHAVVTLKQGSDKEWKISLGREGPVSGENAVVYATSSDRPRQPLAVKRSALDHLFKSAKDFLPLTLLNASAFNATSLNLRHSQGELSLEKGKEGWRFRKPDYGEADFEGDAAAVEPKPITGVKDLLDAVGNIYLASKDDFLTLNASDQELEKYGLTKDKPATLRIEARRTSVLPLGGEPTSEEPVTEVLLIGAPVASSSDKKEEKKEGKNASPPLAPRPSPLAPQKYYACLEGERAVVQVEAKSIATLLKAVENPAVFRNRDLARIDIGKTDALDIQNSAGLLKLRFFGTSPTWKLLGGPGGVSEAEASAILELLNLLNTRRQIKEFPPTKSDAEYGFDKPAAVVSVWMDGLQKEEKKESSAEPKLKSDKPAVKLTFGKKDKDLVYVKRERGDDKPLVAAVPDTLLAKAAQGRVAYLSKSLIPFPEKDVVKLELERDGKVFEIEREKKDESAFPLWKLKQPKEMAGKNADARNVNGVIGVLAQIYPERWEAEKADLEKYGLKQPAVKVTLTLTKPDKKTETRVYRFGKETDDKKGVFAKQDERDLVFVVRPELLSLLRSELEDLSVFRFDPMKVKAIKLTGWKRPAEVLQMERKPDQSWEVKIPPKDFDLDALQADGFVSSLAHLRAQRIVVRKTGPAAGHKLGEADRALQVEILLDGEKTPLTLTIGGFDANEKGFFAQSSTLPGDVFLLPPKPFEELLKAGPGYFKKGAEKK